MADIFTKAIADIDAEARLLAETPVNKGAKLQNNFRFRYKRPVRQRLRRKVVLVVKAIRTLGTQILQIESKDAK